MADAPLASATVQARLDGGGASSTADHSGNHRSLLDTQLVGAPVEIPAKKKRGRPPRNPAVNASAVAKSDGNSNNKRSKKEEEDVCFICFDGGNLVLCDRRDCPKAYHPACVKRDESFFRRSIRWNCGWHLCNSCQRNALFMCYTCPYSLCKGCVKQADILCVRGNKGFCRTCMTTIMLIENIPQESKELVWLISLWHDA
uniref:Zinc finger PHD-type domain-containing protein n=1 Tax=Opuntia streptacantha TaxID=393608 RepID=A0A7C8ZTL7_OPUST